MTLCCYNKQVTITDETGTKYISCIIFVLPLEITYITYHVT